MKKSRKFQIVYVPPPPVSVLLVSYHFENSYGPAFSRTLTPPPLSRIPGSAPGTISDTSILTATVRYSSFSGWLLCHFSCCRSNNEANSSAICPNQAEPVRARGTLNTTLQCRRSRTFLPFKNRELKKLGNGATQGRTSR